MGELEQGLRAQVADTLRWRIAHAQAEQRSRFILHVQDARIALRALDESGQEPKIDWNNLPRATPCIPASMLDDSDDVLSAIGVLEDHDMLEEADKLRARTTEEIDR